MTERKNFFHKNNLNKGHAKQGASSEEQQQAHELADKYKNLVPPLEIMQEYEAQFPGAFDKLMKLTEKEQAHKHKVQELQIQNSQKWANIVNFSIWAVFIIIVSGFALSYYFIMKNIFATFAFLILPVFLLKASAKGMSLNSIFKSNKNNKQNRPKANYLRQHKRRRR